MLFDDLICASFKVVKDFISHIYNNLRTVYKKFKVWLWELQGKFSQHDAFVDACYGYMDDVEQFEWDCYSAYNDADVELALARLHLDTVLKAPKVTGWPVPTRPDGAPTTTEVPKYPTLHELAERIRTSVRRERVFQAAGEASGDKDAEPESEVPEGWHVDVWNKFQDEERTYWENYYANPIELAPQVIPVNPGVAEPPMPKPIYTERVAFTEDELFKAEARLTRAKCSYSSTVEDIKDQYEEEKGEGYFGRFFNTFEQRMHYVKRARSRRAKTDQLCHKVQGKLSQVAELPDFYELCTVREVETGEFHTVMDEGEEIKRPIVKVSRSIKPECRRDAQSYIRKYIRSKNNRVGADEIGVATINRYVAQFADDMKLDMASSEFLARTALTIVPVITKQEMMQAMVIHSPAARKARADLAALEGQDFLEGLLTASGFESPFSILGLPEIVVRSGCLPRKVKSRISYLSQFSLGLDYRVPNPSFHNALVAVERRVFTVGKGDDIVRPPKPRRNIFEERLGYFRDKIVADVGPLRTCTVAQLVSTYKSSKRRQYELAAFKLRKKPVCKEDADVTAFLKMEKHWMCKAIAPRLICPRSKRYNIELGRRLKLNEKRFMHAIDNVFGSATVLSGYDNFKQGRLIAGKWNKFRNPVAIGVDASRFDQHVSTEALKWEHSIYNKVFGDPLLRDLLDWQTVNKCSLFVEDKMLRFKVKGHRMSGDINTSMGNKLIMCGMMHNYFRELGVKAELCNNGDDCVIICERKDERKFDGLGKWFWEYGFNMAIEPPVYSLAKLEFCQSRPVCINGKYRMVRRPDSIAKDANTMLSMQNAEDVKSFMSATGQCGMILNSGVPILDAYHSNLYRGSGYKKVSESFIDRVISYGTDERLQGRRTRVEEPVTMENRLSYWDAFGVDPQTQVLVERYLNNLRIGCEPLGVKIVTPLLTSTLLEIPYYKPLNLAP
nr:ORF1-ORF2 [Apple luteovirus 1]UYP65688.1 P1-P2 polyprotein [Apple luteovirus 1]